MSPPTVFCVSNSFGVKSLRAKDFLRGLPLIDAIFLEPRNLFLEKLETIFPDVYSEDSPFRGCCSKVNLICAWSIHPKSEKTKCSER